MWGKYASSSLSPDLSPSPSAHPALSSQPLELGLFGTARSEVTGRRAATALLRESREKAREREGAAGGGNSSSSREAERDCAFPSICTVTRTIWKEEGGAVRAAVYLDPGAQCVCVCLCLRRSFNA